MTASGAQDKSRTMPAPSALMRRLDGRRRFARLAMVCEQIAPRLLLPASLVAVFVSLAWLGLFRQLPDLLRWPLVVGLVFATLASLLPLARIRWPGLAEADARLEQRNGLSHQPLQVQVQQPAFETPFARALWEEHQRRMAQTIAGLQVGAPQPDLARFDRHGLRAIPALLLVIAFAYSGSNGAGRLADAFHLSGRPESGAPGLRIDAWITPPAYTGRPPVFLTGRDGNADPRLSVPVQSVVTVRLSGGSGTEEARFKPASGGEAIVLPADEKQGPSRDGPSPGGTVAPANAAAPGQASPPSTLSASVAPAGEAMGRSFAYALPEDGTLMLGDATFAISVIPDRPPTIAFDGLPKPALNGALEIRFTARDDYGIQEARADILPVQADPDATPLYPLPEFKLDMPRRAGQDVKGRTSRNLTEHPLAGKKVRITLVAKDGSGQEGRSPSLEMVLPPHAFGEPLAAAVAEQRQVFALDTRAMPKAIALNEALTLRADETIPNSAHYLLIESARARMQLAKGEAALKDTADYLWEIALGIDNGDVALAERRLAEAQKKLSDALDRKAPDAEIEKLMAELRAAMQDYMKALAERQQNRNAPMQRNAQRTLTERDLQNMMNQIETLARSGNMDAARQMLSEMQRMMNNLQAGRPQRGNPQQQQQNDEARALLDKLGRIVQDQQKLMDQTFKMDQALQDRMQQGEPNDDGNGMTEQAEPGDPQGRAPDQGNPRGQMPPGQTPPGQTPTEQMTAEQLREALKQLRGQQEALAKQLKEVQEGLGKFGVKPNDGFGRAGKEMQGAGNALGKADGTGAVEGQGRALEALRQGTRDMMNQMMQAMRQGQQPGQQPGQGQGPGMADGQGGRQGTDPMGRNRPNQGLFDDSENKIPDVIDAQRAREILDAIRDKLGNGASPEEERRYLERLLNL